MFGGVERRAKLVHADKMAGAMLKYGTRLAFLEACQTAQSEEEMNAVATRLLEEGVTLIVAMSELRKLDYVIVWKWGRASKESSATSCSGA